MKLKFKLVLLSLVAIIITSCDPPHYIDLINTTQSPAKVRFNLKSKVESYELKDIATSDSIVFNVNPKDTANIHFGIGDWSDSGIEEVTKSVKSIEIATKDITTKYKTENSIKNLLKKNRHGFFFKTKIEIEIQ